MDFTNLPTKKSELPIVCEYQERGVYRVSDGTWKICEISTYSKSHTAIDIALAIKHARDVGYKQAMAEIRRTLGIND